MPTHPEPPLPRSQAFDLPPETFNPSTWLNSVLTPHHRSTPTNSPLTPRPIPDLQTLLDLTTDSLRHAHDTLETSLKSCLSTVPWAVRETENIRQRAKVLRTGVDGATLRISNVESHVVTSVKTIADADTIVRRVQLTTELLATASQAETLFERLETLLAGSGGGSDLVAAADVVRKLRVCVQGLGDVKEVGDMVERLKRGDKRLESLAAPQLLAALEKRDVEGARNARIVFDHADRGDAFEEQVVDMRAGDIGSVWDKVWREGDEENTIRGDIAMTGAQERFKKFYEGLVVGVEKEGAWLGEAFPEMRDLLLARIVVKGVGNVNGGMKVSIGVGGMQKCFGVAYASVRASAKVAKALLPDGFDAVDEEKEDEESMLDEKVVSAIVDSATAVMEPYRRVWASVSDMCVLTARTEAESFEMSYMSREAVTRPALGDFAKDVESVAKECVVKLDDLVTNINQMTCGVGIEGMQRCARTMATRLSERLQAVLRLPERGKPDEWSRVSGALRLLIAAGGMKRAWDARKESAFAVAVGTATPVLEIASVIRDHPERRLRQLLEYVEDDRVAEAGAVWECARDARLTDRVVSSFETQESDDFCALLTHVQRLAFDVMFDGIRKRFSTFAARDFWQGDDEDASLAISSSPLGYATEVADYLMTIPQQLEPFVPEEDDAPYTMPKHAFVFAKGKRVEEDEGAFSFAGMWISVLSIGTMELYVDKVMSVSRLGPSGCRQLATDMDYMCNVIASLGVSPTPEISLITKLLLSAPEASAYREAATTCTTADERKLARRLASIRGISVTL